jgi:hypothetical protein
MGQRAANGVEVDATGRDDQRAAKVPFKPGR